MQTAFALASKTAAPTHPSALNHIGFAVASIRKAGLDFAGALSFKWDGEVIFDPLQLANVTFLHSSVLGQPTIELVEPAEEKSPLYRFVQQGGGLHHLCYEVDSLEQQMELSRSHGALILKPPVPAVAFGGRHIAWVYTRQKLLLEYLER